MAASQPAAEQVEEFVLAAHKGDLETIKARLSDQPTLREARWEKTGETALDGAAHVGQRAVVEYLLERGAEPDVCVAAVLGRHDQVAAMIDANPALAEATGAHGIPLMVYVGMSGDTEIADLLVEKGGGAAGLDGALHGAVAYGHLAMTKWLLARGANPSVPNWQGKPSLKIALDAGHTAVADFLRQHGARE